ncbi:hypothetical protein [Micromonospora sp. CPCC 206061]|uniref:hypothetical protein n=1 Tax=Micromonospora sp. CPCC 206061 TaxID=3122410 RepID=UPI002FF0D7FA
MTLLISLAVFVAAIGTVVVYVAWRDRHRRGMHIDPSVSHGAIAQAQWQAAQGYAVDTCLTSRPLPRNQARAHERHHSS